MSELPDYVDRRLWKFDPMTGEPLDSAQPKPEQQWRGLTSTERKVLWLTSNNPAEFGEFIEAKLREKNERRA
jgi:hypothetical protein